MQNDKLIQLIILTLGKSYKQTVLHKHMLIFLTFAAWLLNAQPLQDVRSPPSSCPIRKEPEPQCNELYSIANSISKRIDSRLQLAGNASTYTEPKENMKSVSQPTININALVKGKVRYFT